MVAMVDELRQLGAKLEELAGKWQGAEAPVERQMIIESTALGQPSRFRDLYERGFKPLTLPKSLMGEITFGRYIVRKKTAADLRRQYKELQAKIDGIQSELADWAGDVFTYIHDRSKEKMNGGRE